MKTHTQKLSTSWQICLLLMFSAILIMLPDLANASGGSSAPPGVNTPMGAVICTVVKWFTGNTGKGLATIAITVIGVGALLGKVSWGMAIIVGVGIAILFGASGIVDAMFSGTGGTVVKPASGPCPTNA